MEPMQHLAHTVSSTSDFARSALPGAPVVPFEPRPKYAPRTRSAIAGSLHRLGDAIAPSSQQPGSAAA